MKIMDISVPISPSMPVWPGNPPVVLEQVSSMDAGAHDNVSRLDCGVHTGTHVDAPHHFLNNHQTVKSLSLGVLTGPAQVIQVADEVNFITAEVLEKVSIDPATVRLALENPQFRALGPEEKQNSIPALWVSPLMGPPGW